MRFILLDFHYNEIKLSIKPERVMQYCMYSTAKVMREWRAGVKESAKEKQNNSWYNKLVSVIKSESTSKVGLQQGQVEKECWGSKNNMNELCICWQG